jgi:hypothetical protein
VTVSETDWRDLPVHGHHGAERRPSWPRSAMCIWSGAGSARWLPPHF